MAISFNSVLVPNLPTLTGIATNVSVVNVTIPSVPSTTNGLLVLTVHLRVTQGQTVAGASIGVQNFTLAVRSGASNGTRSEIWVLQAPALGVNKTLSIAIAGGTAKFGYGLQLLEGVRQPPENPYSFTGFQSGLTSTPTVQIDSAANEWVIDCMTHQGVSTSHTAGAGQTKHYDVNTAGQSASSNVGGASSTEVATGAVVSMDWGLLVTVAWAVNAISLVPASTGATFPRSASASISGISSTSSKAGSSYKRPAAAALSIAATGSRAGSNYFRPAAASISGISFSTVAVIGHVRFASVSIDGTTSIASRAGAYGRSAGASLSISASSSRAGVYGRPGSVSISGATVIATSLQGYARSGTVDLTVSATAARAGSGFGREAAVPEISVTAAATYDLVHLGPTNFVRSALVTVSDIASIATKPGSGYNRAAEANIDGITFVATRPGSTYGRSALTSLTVVATGERAGSNYLRAALTSLSITTTGSRSHGVSRSALVTITDATVVVDRSGSVYNRAGTVSATVILSSAGYVLTPVGVVFIFYGNVIRQIDADPSGPYGVANFYFEAMLKTTDASKPCRVSLYNVSDSVVVPGSEITSTSTTFGRVRSPALSLSSTKEYRVQYGGLSGGVKYSIADPVIIVRKT